MDSMNSYLIIASSIFCLIIGILCLKFEWQKHKSGTDYWITNHFKALIVLAIFFVIVLYEIFKKF